MVTRDDAQYPPEVTFAAGAQLLVQLDIDPNATADYIRHISRSRDDWPFGDDGRHPYGQIANARTMDTEVFLKYFREHPPNAQRRGRDRQPRAKKPS